MAAIHLQIITPERTLLDEEVDSVTCAGSEGQITILPGHMPLVAELVPGELIARHKGQEKTLHVGGGFLRIEKENLVTLLSDAAEHIVEIDVARAEEAIIRAKEIMAQQELSDREYAMTAALLERNYARVRIVRKTSHHRRAPITSEGVLEE